MTNEELTQVARDEGYHAIQEARSKPLPSSACSPLDELCVRMLSLGAMGGCGGGTDHLKASEIKTLLIPFFGLDRVNRCTAALCEENGTK
jgi:hypothetical protein